MMGASHNEGKLPRRTNGESTIPICVVGRNRIFRLALHTLLNATEFDVVCDAESLTEACETLAEDGELRAETIQLVLYDAPRDNARLADDLQDICERLPFSSLVVLNSGVDMDTLETCLRGGAAGYLDKDISLEILVHSLQLVCLGEKVFPTNLAELLLNDRARHPLRKLSREKAQKLSEREWQIVQCLIDGDSNKQIAIRLDITESTVKVHMKSLLRKIEVENRTQAAIWALSELPTLPAAVPASTDSCSSSG